MSIDHTFLPTSICIRVCRKCNAQCIFCQSPTSFGSDLPLSEFEKFIIFFKKHGVKSIKLSGGEPTLRKDLFQFVRIISEYQMRPVVISNGININKNLLASLKGAGGELKISLHHYDYDKNDLLLGVTKTREIVKNIERFKDEGIRLSINTVIFGQFYDDYNVMIDFIKSIGASKLTFIPLIPRGKAKKLRLSDNLIKNIKQKVLDIIAQTTSHDMELRYLDLNNNDFWILEYDGNLYVEGCNEEKDVIAFPKTQMLEEI